MGDSLDQWRQRIGLFKPRGASKRSVAATADTNIASELHVWPGIGTTTFFAIVISVAIGSSLLLPASCDLLPG